MKLLKIMVMVYILVLVIGVGVIALILSPKDTTCNTCSEWIANKPLYTNLAVASGGLYQWSIQTGR